MTAATPHQGPENGEPQSIRASRAAREYRPGRSRHVENTVMSALVRVGLVPRSCLLTTRGAQDRPAAHQPRSPGGTRRAVLAGSTLRAGVLGA